MPLISKLLSYLVPGGSQTASSARKKRKPKDRSGWPHYEGQEIHICPIHVDEDDPEGRYRGDDGLYDDYNGPSNAKNFGLSKELQQRFRTWSRAVIAQEEPDTGEIPAELNEEGLELARAVKREKPHRVIVYIDKDYNRTVIE